MQRFRHRRAIGGGPFADSGTDPQGALWRFEERLRTFGRGGGPARRSRSELFDVAALDLHIHQDVVEERRRLRAFVYDCVERQAVARAGHGHIKQAALLLDMKTPLGLLFLHQFAREFKHARPFSCRESALHQTQNVDVVEFESFRGMNGHQLHGVARFLLQIDRAAGLLEIVQVLDKFLELLRFAFRLPLAHKLGKPVEIFSVLRRHGRPDIQCFY